MRLYDNSSDPSHHPRPNLRSKCYDRLLDRAALWRERPDDDSVDAGPRERHGVIDNFLNGSSEG
jgi:hypothetical protein